jgi:IS605 OrfB family transposase
VYNDGLRIRQEAREQGLSYVRKAVVRVADARRDFAHRLSTQIIRENQAVVVEDLCVRGLARTKLAKSVHDAGWGHFTATLASKAARHGRTERLNACGDRVGPPFAVARVGEAGSRRGAA